MVNKAQFQGHGLRVYVTRDDFDQLLINKWVEVPLQFLKEKPGGETILLTISEEVARELEAMRTAETQAIKDKFAPVKEQVKIVARPAGKGAKRGKSKSTRDALPPVPENDDERGGARLSTVDGDELRAGQPGGHDDQGEQGQG